MPTARRARVIEGLLNIPAVDVDIDLAFREEQLSSRNDRGVLSSVS